MYHFFVNQEQIGQDTVTVTGPDVNHIKNVLRMKPGEEVLISNYKDVIRNENGIHLRPYEAKVFYRK